MDTYSLLREIADSWVLLAMFLFFIGVILWAFRPGSREMHRETSQIPFRNEDAPASESCGKGCPDCVCKTLNLDLEIRS